MVDGFFPGSHSILLYFLAEVGEIAEMHFKQNDLELGLLPQFQYFVLDLDISLPQFVNLVFDVVFLELEVRFQIVDADVQVVQSSLPLLPQLLLHYPEVLHELVLLHFHLYVVVSSVVLTRSHDQRHLFVQKTVRSLVPVLACITIY